MQSLLHTIGVGLILIFFLKALGNLLIQYKITSFSHHQQIRLRSYLMRTYQNLPYQDFITRNSSEYVHSVQILVPSYGGVLSTLLKTICDILIACTIIIVLAWTNLMILSVLLLLLVGLIFLFDQNFKNRLREYGKRYNEANHIIVQSLTKLLMVLKSSSLRQRVLF